MIPEESLEEENPFLNDPMDEDAPFTTNVSSPLLKSRSRCFMCGCRLVSQCSRALEQSEMLKTWNSSLASSICVTLELDYTFQQIFSDADYCISCLELSASADFTINAMSRLRSELTAIEERVKYLLHENYGNITRYHGLTNDESGKSSEQIVRIIEMKISFNLVESNHSDDEQNTHTKRKGNLKDPSLQ